MYFTCFPNLDRIRIIVGTQNSKKKHPPPTQLRSKVQDRILSYLKFCAI